MRQQKQRRWAYLTIASFIFYGWWDWRFLFLIIGSGLIDFYAAQGMVRFPARRKLLLIVSVCANLGTLGFFKYAGFFLENINGIMTLFGGVASTELSLLTARLVLPVGISFYTFQSMSYTIDVYRNRLKPTNHLLHFFAYLALFPQLVAGPIVRAVDLLPQLAQEGERNHLLQWKGLRLVAVGYFKKVVIADNLAPYVNSAFEQPSAAGGSFYWWPIIIAFAIQIYCDFSGYSNIARGLAHWMGYRLGVNFNEPYGSTSLREFWTRWHISLSSWFRDYVYIPLGGSRKGAARAHLYMWITMILSGLWHGASWNFAIWGALHAAFLSLERWTRWPEKVNRWKTGRWLAFSLINLQVLIAWVFFRADTFADAQLIVRSLFTIPKNIRVPLPLEGFAILFIVITWQLLRFVYHNHGQRRPAKLDDKASALQIATTIVLIVAAIFLRGPGSEFIYFQF